jgi:hypothetical protein
MVSAVASACSSDDNKNSIPPATTDSGGGGDSTFGDGGTGFDAPLSPDSITTFETGPSDTGPGPSNLFDAGPQTTLDGGGPDGSGLPCYAGGVAEVEPNDTAGAATTLPNKPVGTPAVMCGVLEAADGGGASDFVSYKVSAGAQSVKVNWYGNIVQPPPITVKGVADPFTTIQKNDPYVFEIKPNGTGPIYWQLLILEE